MEALETYVLWDNVVGKAPKGNNGETQPEVLAGEQEGIAAKETELRKAYKVADSSQIGNLSVHEIVIMRD